MVIRVMIDCPDTGIKNTQNIGYDAPEKMPATLVGHCGVTVAIAFIYVAVFAVTDDKPFVVQGTRSAVIYNKKVAIRLLSYMFGLI